MNKTSGSGFGGSASDKQKRNKGKKEARKRENGTWTEWHNELEKFLAQHRDSRTNASIDRSVLNTLKKVLRCQAPDWWWKGLQQKMYLLAIKVSIVLTEQYPQDWGDPDDTESAIGALEELAEMSKILVASSTASASDASVSSAKGHSSESKTLSTKKYENNTHDNGSINAYNWIRDQTSKKRSVKHKFTVKDMLLPKAVLQLKEEAMAASKKFIEQPECSMVGTHDYYRQKMRPLAFSMVEGSSFENPKHYYAPGGGCKRYRQSRLPNSKASSPSKSQSSAAILWKELSAYPTALPVEYGSSIFVRALETELDKLRVLIIGPEDTPYANGCFFFDVIMGDDYPNKPPKVQFLTTTSFLPTACGNKRVRFNPNLYADGKVCMSLLGTWTGPSWTPKESTLLQVLVSLQSLILGTANPFFNEPGYERMEGTLSGDRNTKAYNVMIRQQTLKVAMLPFLYNQLGGNVNECSGMNDCKAAPVPRANASIRGNHKRKSFCNASFPPNHYFSEFKEVIQQHFRIKKRSIQTQLFQWLKEDVAGLEALISEYWSVFNQLEEQRKKLLSASKRSRTIAGTFVTASPAIPRSKGRGNKDEAIELLPDSEDEKSNSDNNRKMSVNTVELLVDSDDDNENNCKAKHVDYRKPPAATIELLVDSDGDNNYGVDAQSVSEKKSAATVDLQINEKQKSVNNEDPDEAIELLTDSEDSNQRDGEAQSLNSKKPTETVEILMDSDDENPAQNK